MPFEEKVKEVTRRCGDYGGVTKAGKPCGMWAGAGIPHVETGPCYHHADPDLVPDPSDEGLSFQHQAFVDAYVGPARFNATKAAIMAGYSQRSAHVKGCNLTKEDKIRDAIARRLKSRVASAEEVMARLTEWSRATLNPFFVTGDDGRVYCDLSSDEAQKYFHLIKKVKQKELHVEHDDDGVTRSTIMTEVELFNAEKALTELAKIHRLYTEETTVNVELRIQRMSDAELRAQIREKRRRLDLLTDGKDDRDVSALIGDPKNN